MENIQKNPSQTLFHTQMLESELKQLNLDSRKMVLQQWCDRLGELRQQDHISQVSTFTSEILEKLLGYSASGNTVTIAPDSTPEPFFDILVGHDGFEVRNYNGDMLASGRNGEETLVMLKDTLNNPGFHGKKV